MAQGIKAPPLSRASKDHPEILEVEVETGKHGPRKLPRQIKCWLDRAKQLGLHNKQLVWELHVVQGHSKSETARLLQLSVSRVWQCYEEVKRELLDRVPKTPEDFEQLREELKDRLISVLEDASKNPADPRMLAIRLKTLDQLAKLHGLNLEAPALQNDGAGQYATPDELAELVRERALRIHGRERDVTEARLALAQAASEGASDPSEGGDSERRP